MAVGTDLKRKLKNNQKYVVGIGKAAEHYAVGRRETGIRGNGRRRGGHSERDGIDSDGESYKRVISENNPKYGVGIAKTEDYNALGGRKRGIRGNGRRWGGYSERDGVDSDGETYKRVRSQYYPKYGVGIAKVKEHNAFGGRERGIRGNGRRRGGHSERDDMDSDGESYKRVRSQNYPKYGVGIAKAANFNAVGGRERSIRGNGRRWGGYSQRNGLDSDGETYKSVRSQNRKTDSGIRGNKSLRKGIERKVGGVENLGLGDAVQKGKRTENARGYRGNGRFNDSWVSNKKLMPINRKLSLKTCSDSSKGSYNAVGSSDRQPVNVKGTDSDNDSSMVEESSFRVRHASKDYGRKTELVHDRKHSRRDEDKIENVEASAGKLRSKVKWIGERISKKRRGAVGDGSLGQHAEITDHPNENSQLKNISNQGKPAERSGKKTTSSKKASKDDSVTTDDPPKKKKRVIRIDPHDISNKRIDDSASAHNEKIEEEIELSKNAQFRAIKPSPSILSFVEDNLLGRRRMTELRNAGYNIKLSAPLDNIPFSTSPERERIEENVFRNKLEFFAAAKVSSSFPPLVLPEIAFAGRSNVGKSSLLNALTRQWGVVRTSDKPGHTQTINFFRLASKLCLVDLPGYGFAYAKEEVKDAWEELVKEYVCTRGGLKRVCLLIDTKWGMKPRDHELIDLMERSQTPYQVVLTKTDAVFPMDLARRAMQIQENLKTNKSIVDPVVMVSSKSGAGIRSLRTVLTKLARYIKP